MTPKNVKILTLPPVAWAAIDQIQTTRFLLDVAARHDTGAVLARIEIGLVAVGGPMIASFPQIDMNSPGEVVAGNRRLPMRRKDQKAAVVEGAGQCRNPLAEAMIWCMREE